MAEQKLLDLPIGIQNFEELRTGNFLYVDKTKAVYDLARIKTPYFLSRPRRFGKSLLCSTFKALFEGKKHLFEGTWIANSDWEWKSHPVIYLSFATIPHATPAELTKNIMLKLIEIGQHYGVTLPSTATTPGAMLEALIKQLAAIGPVVMIVDEYDKPLINNLHNVAEVNEFKKVFKAFYGCVKDAGYLMRFLFFTGVSQFSMVSIFSDLNHLENISSSPTAATICGYTQQELEYCFDSYLQKAIATFDYDADHMLAEIKHWYNGYCFTIPEDAPERVYNPFSVLNFFKMLQFRNYWFASGTPSFVIEYFKTHEFATVDFEQVLATDTTINYLDPENLDLTTLLYQAGYLTIKTWPRTTGLITLGFPNHEVARSCAESLFRFVAHEPPTVLRQFATQLRQLFSEKTLTEDALMAILKKICAQIPSTVAPQKEKGYQFMFWLVLQLSGLDVHVEDPTAIGRIDATILVGNHAYLLELKIRGTGKKALEQIEERRYAEKYLTQGLTVTSIGAVFDIKKKTMTACVIL